MTRYVIVGGVAGGASAAARLRRRDEEAETIMIERGEFVSFANCGLPYHIGETIQERDALLVSTPEKLYGEFDIDVRTRQEVTAIDPQSRTVTVRRLEDDESYSLAYDKLVLSPGAKPFVPPIQGHDLDGVFTLRNIPDMDRIKAKVDSGMVREAVVAGGGFIGLEMAENLVERGVQVTLVEMMSQVMAALDFELAAHIHQEMMDHGVRLALGDGLKAVKPLAGDRLQVVLSSGKTVASDMVIMALGVRPESGLAKEAGLDVGARGHILVDDTMRTSDPDIYAVGDAIQVTNPVTGEPTAVPLAGPANRQARIAADNITGLEAHYQGTLGTAIVKAFGLTAACTGSNSRALEHAGLDVWSSMTISQDHVSYYPGATQQTIKLLYDRHDGRLYGAQVVGQNAVDRTIDALAVAIKAGMTVFDLEHLELAYAPPYGSAKDPVNVAGFVAANRLRGDTEMVEWQQIADLDPEQYGILDVRTELEASLGTIPGAVHIENHHLRERMVELDKAKTWILYCSMGRRAYVMERMLRQNGYKVANLSGGWGVYRVATAKQSNFDEFEGDQETVEVEIMAKERAIADVETVPATVAVSSAVELDACGLQCPGPIMAVYKEMQALAEGERLRVTATDPGFRRDIAAWCERTGNTLNDVSTSDGVIEALLTKGAALPQIQVGAEGNLPAAKTLVVFSADFDRALAAFVIANGAAAMGQQVTLFFTFWGLNVLRRENAEPVKKNLIERMFGWMLPKGPEALKLSKLNMGGAGTAMMKGVMRSKNIDSLPAMMRSAQDAGVRLIACQMSMDMMGIKPEELIDGVEIGGVATYISETDKANASLFI